MTHGIVSPDHTGELEYSAVSLPIGALSEDHSAVVGAGGHLFLVGGSNGLIRQYAEPTEADQIASLRAKVLAWSTLTESRDSRARAAGAEYVQICIPDKSSSLDSRVAGLGPVTPLLRDVDRELADAPFYVSGRSALAEASQDSRSVNDLWLRGDSHLGPRGAAVEARALISALTDASFMDDVRFSPSGVFLGDLGARFFGRPIPEPDLVPASPWLEKVAQGRVLQSEHRPESGHTGRMLHWVTPQAPIDAKVLVFGNSFFSGGDHPRGLNFWISRAFKEHRFVWSAEMLDEVISEQRPDVIICQTVERFMTSVPPA
ncbi:hypothetical protein [Microbacterium sp. NPDC080220]|uniref:hypothetical protein n=1 Tax=Microbacterium sp. NPDC080220 TaxID=3161017 RepID=UPI003421D724